MKSGLTLAILAGTMLLSGASCSPLSNLIRLAGKSWTSDWGVILEQEGRSDPVLEELAKAESKPNLLAVKEAEQITLMEEGGFTFVMGDVATFTKFAKGIPQALPRRFHFYTNYEPIEQIEPPPLFIDSNVFMVEHDPEGNITLHEMFSNKIRDNDTIIKDCSNEKDLVTVQLACTRSDGVLCDPLEGMWDRRTDFKGACIKAAGLLGRPSFVNAEALMEQLPAHLNVTVHFVPSVDETWGSKRPDGDGFTGLVGMAHRGEVDASTDGLTITMERASAVEFSASFATVPLQLVVRKPEGSQSDIFSMARIFSPTAWLFVILFYASLSLLMAVLLTWETWTQEKRFKGGSVLDGIAIVMKAAVMSGYEKTPTWVSGKIITISTLLFGTLIFTYYSGNFLTELAVQKEALPKVQSMEDVLQPGIKMGTNPNGSGQAMFENAPAGTLFKRIWKEKMEPMYDEVMIEFFAGVDKTAREENYVCLLPTLMDLPCEVMAVGEEYPDYLAFAFPKGSRIRPAFDRYIRKAKETGFLDYLDRLPPRGPKYLKQKNEMCSIGGAKTTEGLSLGMETVFGVFLILGLGALAATGVACAESMKVTRRKKGT